MSKVSRFVLATALALTAAGCSTTVQGTPATAPSNPAPSSDANPLAALQPCDLLGRVVQDLNYPPVAPDIVNKELACSTRKPDGADIALLLNPDVPFTEQPTNSGSSRPGNIHGRRALQMKHLGKVKGGCAVRLEVKPQANAVISVVSDTTTEQDCQLVDQLATQLEPMLPKN